MKKVFSILIAFIICFSAVSCFAAPEYIEPTEQSNATNLVVITNPPSISSTTQRGVVFCGYGEAGAKVTFYIYDATINKYKQILTNNAPTSLDVVYQSGLFWKKIEFSGGNHKVIVYAEKDGRYQIVKREINVLNPSLSDKIKNYAFNFRPSYR